MNRLPRQLLIGIFLFFNISFFISRFIFSRTLVSISCLNLRIVLKTGSLHQCSKKLVNSLRVNRGWCLISFLKKKSIEPMCLASILCNLPVRPVRVFAFLSSYFGLAIPRGCMPWCRAPRLVSLSAAQVRSFGRLVQ